MKKLNQILSLILLFSLSSIISSAQIVYVNNESTKTNKTSRNILYWNYNAGIYVKGIKQHKLKEVDVSNYEYKKDGKRTEQTSRVIRKYNPNSLKTEYLYFRKGKEFSHSTYKYDSINNLIDYQRSYKGKHFRQTINKYDQYHQLIQRDNYYKNKFNNRSYATYKDSIITAQWTYRKDSSIIAYKWEYNYYSNGDKKTTQYYKKGELKHTWNYTCDEEGEEVKPKEETKVCQLKQYNADSSYVIINRLTDKNGKISKRRKTYDKNDHLILVEHINIKNEITYKNSQTYNKAGYQTASIRFHTGKYSDQISIKSEYEYIQDSIKISEVEIGYKKSGTIRWAHEYKFNKRGKTLESIVYGKKKNVIITRNHTYNEKNQKLSTVATNADGSLKYKNTYKYNDRGLLEETCSYDKNEILKNKSITKYQYY